MKKLKIISLMFFTISILIGSFAFADTQGFLPNSNTSANNVYSLDQRRLISNAKQFPYNTVVNIQGVFPKTKAGWVAGGTGVIIAPNVVLTAGHVVYDKTQGG